MDDYEIDEDTDTDSVLEEGCNKEREPIHCQCIFAVLESRLMELLKFSVVLHLISLNMGSQLSYRFRCVKGITFYHFHAQVEKSCNI